MDTGHSVVTTQVEHSHAGRRASTRSSAKAGRPRSRGIDTAVLGAAVALLSERGLEGTTMSAVIERSGASRASVYLRWPNLQALLASAARHAMGRDVLRLSGDLAGDCAQIAEQTQFVLGQSEFRSLLPAVLSGMLRNTDERIDFAAVIPERKAMAQRHAALAATPGLQADIRPEIAVDMIMGAMLCRVLATGEAPDPSDAVQILGLVLRGLGVYGPREVDFAPAAEPEGGPQR